MLAWKSFISGESTCHQCSHPVADLASVSRFDYARLGPPVWIKLSGTFFGRANEISLSEGPCTEIRPCTKSAGGFGSVVGFRTKANALHFQWIQRYFSDPPAK